MSRSLSTVTKKAIFAQETDKVFLLLLTISHATLAAPIRVVNDMVDLVSRGNTFTGFPFQIALPDEKDESLPQMKLQIDNVDRSIVTAVRNMTSPATITLEVILASAPDTVEASFSGFTLRDVTYDAIVVEGTLRMEDILNEAFPQHTFTPNLFPALFTLALIVCAWLFS